MAMIFAACGDRPVHDAGEGMRPGEGSEVKMPDRPPAYPIKVIAPAACALDGRIYVTGGWGHIDGERRAAARAYCYDPRENTWERLPDLPRARLFHACVAAGGKLWVLGGMDDDSHNLSAVDCYDPADGGWTTPTKLPTPRNRLGTAEMDGLIYVVGGMDLEGDTDKVEVLDPSTLEWTDADNLPVPMHGLAVAAVGDAIITAGGSRDSTATYRLRPGEDWGSLGVLPDYRLFASAAVYEGSVYLLGNRRHGDIALLRLDGDRWKVEADKSIDTHRASAATLGDHIYVIGGEDPDGGELDRVSRYDPKTGDWAHSD